MSSGDLEQRRQALAEVLEAIYAASVPPEEQRRLASKVTMRALDFHGIKAEVEEPTSSDEEAYLQEAVRAKLQKLEAERVEPGEEAGGSRGSAGSPGAKAGPESGESAETRAGPKDTTSAATRQTVMGASPERAKQSLDKEEKDKAKQASEQPQADAEQTAKADVAVSSGTGGAHTAPKGAITCCRCVQRAANRGGPESSPKH